MGSWNPGPGATGGNDTYNGTSEDEIANGLEGDDTFIMLGGNDRVIGGAGADTIQGGEGADTLHGDSRHLDPDTGAFADTISGGAGDDVIAGGGGIDTLSGGDGDDLVFSGKSLFVAGEETEEEYARTGGGYDIMDGGQGEDIAILALGDETGAITFTLGAPQVTTTYTVGGASVGSLTGFEHVVVHSGSGVDTLRGGADWDFLDGGAGNDTLHGEGGDDIFIVSAGDDLYFGGDGNDAIDFWDFGVGGTIDLGSTAKQTIGGRSFTLNSVESVEAGTTGSDHIIGTDASQFLAGSDGDDLIEGRGGNDELGGDGGVDTLLGGTGDDELWVDIDDTARGGPDNDSYFVTDVASLDGIEEVANEGRDTINIYSESMQAGVVTLSIESLANVERVLAGGYVGAINLTGNAADNDLFGNAMANTIIGGLGNDTLFGDAGNDTLAGQGGDDIIDGGLGVDTASYFIATSGVTVNLTVSGAQATGGAGSDILVGIENLIGSAFNDILTGDGNRNNIFGFGGNDFIAGRQNGVGVGADYLDGGDGLDIVGYGWSATGVTVDLRLAGTGVAGQQVGGAGQVLVGFESIFGSQQADTLTGDSGFNLLNGMGGADHLYSMGGSDNLVGGAGDDTLHLGTTNSADAVSADGGDGVDTVWFSQATGAVTASLAVVGAQATGAGGNVTFVGVESLSGAGFADVLTGDEAANQLEGFAGDDILIGGAGADTLLGGAGEDQLYAQGGNDTLRDGGETTNRDFLYGGAGNDTYYVTSSLTGPTDLAYEGGVNPDLAAGIGDVDVIRSEGEFFWDYYGVAETLYMDRASGSQLVGGTNSQTFWGGVGSDQIIAYGGSNRVDAGAGTDAISFGLYGLDESFDGVNTLVMKAGNGLDYVYEFESGVDKIDLTAFNFGITGAQVLAQAVNVDDVGTANDYCYFYLTNAGGVDNFVAFIGLLSNQLQAGDFIT